MVATTTFLEQDNTSFSRVLLSKVAEIIKHIVKESVTPIHPKCNDRKDFFKGEENGN